MSVTMDDITAFCKRRGFVYQSSEIYNGLASAWDYGPLGVELKANIVRFWWHEMVRKHANIVGIDASILMHPRVWEASGHVENFVDIMTEDMVTHERYRWDHLTDEQRVNRVSPNGNPLNEPRNFNLMFHTTVGSTDETSMRVYLRPETAQGIYVNFKNVLQTNRLSIPFGIAQVGKAFRNEVTTKSFIFRTCEFEQMEMQYFVHPDTASTWFDYWSETRISYYRKLGVLDANLRLHEHCNNELAHYAKKAFDIQYKFPFGWSELEGIHNRGDFDISRHMEFSGKDLRYMEEDKQKYTPYIIETSVGLTRTVLMLLCDAYEEEKIDSSDDVRTVLHLHPKLAPITVGVFPLVKKDGLPELAKKIEHELCEHFATFYDQGGAIGRRYRRQDEIGTPFCITIDYESKTDNSVTVRFRDSMEQVRVSTANLLSFLFDSIGSYKRS